MIVSYNSLMADSALILMKGRTQLSEIGLEVGSIPYQCGV